MSSPSGAVRLDPLGGALGIPVPAGLTPEQFIACERFSWLVWGEPLFDREPSHNGRHGWQCELCQPVLEERRLEFERRASIRQPWELEAA